MQINPYLFYDSNCEAAFKFYEKVLGGRIEAASAPGSGTRFELTIPMKAPESEERGP
mgnify:CR=1 FL=1